MKRLYLYVSTELIKAFVMSLFLLCCIFAVVSLVEIVDDVLERNEPFVFALKFVYCRIPIAIEEFAFAAALIASVFVFGSMAKNNEIVALKSSGISLRVLYTPLVLVAFFVSFLAFLNSAFVVGDFRLCEYYTKNVLIRKKQSMARLNPVDIWIKDKDWYCNIGLFSSVDKSLSNVKCISFRQNRVLIADRVVWNADDKGWVIKEGSIWDTALFKRYNLEGKRFFINYEILKDREKKPQEMNILELYAVIKHMISSGLNASSYIMELSRRVVYTIGVGFMFILGLPVGLKFVRSRGLFFGISFGLAVAFVFWLLFYLLSFLVNIGIMSSYVVLPVMGLVFSAIFVVPLFYLDNL